MKSQQAASTSAQAVGDVPLQTALISSQSRSPGSVRQARKRRPSVTDALKGEETQRRRKPVIAAMLALDQLQTAVEEIADARDQQAEEEIARHGHRHDLQGLARLVQGGAREDQHQIGVADRRSERGVLEQRDILA